MRDIEPDGSSTWLWWSSGKDSAWALQVLRARAELNVTALVTTVNAAFDRVAMHGVRTELVRAQAEAAGLPLHVVDLPWPCTNAEYEEAATAVVRRAEERGVTHMAFGDLFLADVRAYRETLLAESVIRPVFPLWGLDTTQLAHEMIAAGVRAHLTCVDLSVLEREFAGRAYDAALLRQLPSGTDPCGERGEFHTFVFDGPMFSRPLGVAVGECVDRDGFRFADLTAADAPQER